MIEVIDLKIGYLKHKPIFKNIAFKALPGELIGIIGNNGVGKSTLIKTLTKSLEPISGEIIINQINSTKYTPQQLAQVISIVNTERIGGFNLTVWDVVALGRTPYINIFGKLNSSDIEIITQSLERLHILQMKDVLINELSDGQRQKVMIAKSLAQQTPIIILDEPTAFLDYNSKHQLFFTLKQLCEQQAKLILVSSHDLDLMNKYTHRSFILEEPNQFSIQ
ncbi:MAG: ABC transporter ATP-binding protein [Bacteroidia bacterium]|nr:ABC transporter ATP-binding protein [Bacteroidia bacterium]